MFFAISLITVRKNLLVRLVVYTLSFRLLKVVSLLESVNIISNRFLVFLTNLLKSDTITTSSSLMNSNTLLRTGLMMSLPLAFSINTSLYFILMYLLLRFTINKKYLYLISVQLIIFNHRLINL